MKNILLLFFLLHSILSFSQTNYDLLLEGRRLEQQNYDSTLHWYGVYLYRDDHYVYPHYSYVIKPVKIKYTTEPQTCSRVTLSSKYYDYSTDIEEKSIFLIGSKEIFQKCNKIIFTSSYSPQVKEWIYPGRILAPPYLVGNDTVSALYATGSVKKNKTEIITSDYNLYYQYPQFSESVCLNNTLQQFKTDINLYTYPNALIEWFGDLNGDKAPDLLIWTGQRYCLWMTEKSTAGEIILSATLIRPDMIPSFEF